MPDRRRPGPARPDAPRRGVFVVLPELAPPARPGIGPAGFPLPEWTDPGDGAEGEGAPGRLVIFSECPLADGPSLPGTGLALAAAFAARCPDRATGACVPLPRRLPDLVRLAEEVGTAAGLAPGRLHLVVAPGREAGEGPLAVDEALELLRRAWVGELLGTGGGAVAVHPRPPAPPRLWLVGRAPQPGWPPGVGRLLPAAPGPGGPPEGELVLRVIGAPGAAERWLVGIRGGCPPSAGT